MSFGCSGLAGFLILFGRLSHLASGYSVPARVIVLKLPSLTGEIRRASPGTAAGQ
jgi:hypothetical protein